MKFNLKTAEKTYIKHEMVMKFEIEPVTMMSSIPEEALSKDGYSYGQMISTAEILLVPFNLEHLVGECDGVANTMEIDEKYLDISRPRIGPGNRVVSGSKIILVESKLVFEMLERLQNTAFEHDVRLASRKRHLLFLDDLTHKITTHLGNEIEETIKTINFLEQIIEDTNRRIKALNIWIERNKFVNPKQES